MDNNETQAVENAASTKPARKRVVRQRPAKAAPEAVAATPKAKAPREPKAPATHYHVEAGVDVSGYEGLSGLLNKNRKAKVLVLPKMDGGDLTGRRQKGLYALRSAYGTKAWRAKGFDGGVLRTLLAMGFIEARGGKEVEIDGQPHLVDGEQPLAFVFTKAGMAYGKVA